jgi:hypothetical protein
MQSRENRIAINKELLQLKDFSAATRLYQKLLICKEHIILRFDDADWNISLAAEKLGLKTLTDCKGVMIVYF